MKDKETITGTHQLYDLTDETSKRDTTVATTEGRKAEGDNVNEEINSGNVPGPEGDASGENRVATLDD